MSQLRPRPGQMVNFQNGMPLVSSVVQMLPPRQVIVESPKNQDDEDERFRQIQEEVENWRRKYFNLEAQMAKLNFDVDQIESTEERLLKLIEENKKLKLELSHKVTDYEQLRVQSGMLELENHDLKLAKIETQRYADLLEQRDDEIGELRRKCGNLDSQLAALSSFELTLKEYESRIDILNQEIEMWKQRYAQQEADRQRECDELRAKVTSLTPQDFDDLKAKNEREKKALLQDIENLKKQIIQLQADNEDWKKKYNQLEAESFQWKSKLQEQQARVENLESVLAKQNDELRAKIGENDTLNVEVQRLAGELKKLPVLEDELGKLGEQLKSKNDECEDLRKLNAELEFNIQELKHELQELIQLQNKVAMLSSEIERLKKKLDNRTEEVEVLKQKCQRYEQQIEELRALEQEKQALENKVAMLAAEIERMGGLLKSREGKMEDLRKQNQALDTQVKELLELRNEINSLHVELGGKDNEIEAWSKRYDELQNIQVLYNQADAKVYDLENKVAMLSSEIQRMQALINQKNQELDDLKQRNSNLETIIQQYQLIEAENQRLKEKQDQINGEADKWRSKNIETEDALAHSQTEIEQLVSEKQLSGNERDKLSQTIGQLEKELAALRIQYLKLQNDLKAISEAEQKITDLENKVAMLSSEIKRLGEMNNKKNDEIEGLRKQVAALEEQIRSFQGLENELVQVKDAHQKALDEIERELALRKQTQDELENALNSKNDLENRIAMLSTEIERFQYKLKNRSDESDKLKEQVNVLNQQLSELSQVQSDNERLNRLAEDSHNQAQVSEQKYREFEQLYNDTLAQREAIENKLAMLSSEIERLGKLTGNKQKEIDQLRQQVIDQDTEIAELKKSEQKMFEYETKLAFLSQEIERQTNQYKVKMGELENNKKQITELEGLLFDQEKLEGELRNQQNIAQTKTKEAADWKGKIDQLEDQVGKLEDTKYQYENKIALLSSEIERQSKKYSNLEEANKQNVEKSKFYEVELDRASKSLDDTSQQLNEWKDKYTKLTALQHQIGELQTLLVVSFAEIETLRKRIVASDGEISSLRRQLVA